MNKNLKALIVFTVCIGSLPIMAGAATVSLTTGEGNGADSYVQSTLSGNNAANQNFGSSTAVAVKHDTALNGNNRKGYLRFDLGSVTDPISDAELLLNYTGTNSDPGANPSIYNVYGLIDGHTGENWGENTITWNNAPGNNTVSSGGVLPAETTLLGTFSLALATAVPGDQISFASPALVAFLLADSDDLVTLILSRQQQNFSVEGFASKESLDWAAPTLNLDLSVNPIPLPPAVWLFATGIVGLIGLSRRKRV